ncbi:MAG: class I SAM-dependent methyltransferase [Pseudonocardiales bacterium]|nr:class I SAM-dependent methyltransferase [Pseudonocardiales bacterium]
MLSRRTVTTPIREVLDSRTFYHYLAAQYAEVVATRRAYFGAVDDIVVVHAPAAPAVLDIGCGDGVRAARLASAVGASHLVLVDIAQADTPSVLKGRFSLVTCLWNVLGHLDGKARQLALRNTADLLAPGGRLMFDVNNRYNAAHYGFAAAFRNFAKDIIGRGDGDYLATRNVGGRMITTEVHVFSQREVRSLLRSAGLAVHREWFVNYRTGHRCHTPWAGQLVVEAKVTPTVQRSRWRNRRSP